MLKELKISEESLFRMAPDNSMLWLRGQVPPEENGLGINYDGEKSIVPFKPYMFKLNSTEGRDCNYFVDWINEGGLERIDRFSHRRNLSLSIRRGDHLDLFLSPITLISVREAERVCIPHGDVLSYTSVN